MKYQDFSEFPMVLSVDDIADTLAIRSLRLGNHYRIPREAFIAFLRGEAEMAS